MNYNFDLDLPVGEEGERLLYTYLLGGKKVEVKRDFLVSKTKNLVVEFESRGNPSGILTTESDWWAFILSGEKYKDQTIILVAVERLKKLINSGGFRITSGGDDNTSKMYLIPLVSVFY